MSTRNPKWHRDEIILALDLYFNPERGPIDKSNPKIIKLSEILNKLPLFSDRPDEKRFRNPNGVTLKLSNFLAIDPSYKGRGMKRYSALDKDIFFEFKNNLSTLRHLASEIRQVAKVKPLAAAILLVEDDEETFSVKEGALLYKTHKYRERDQKIVTKKKDLFIRKHGRLFCELCGFDFEMVYGIIGKGFIECHHVVPLAKLESTAETKLEDLILVCANCHRMEHRKY